MIISASRRTDIPAFYTRWFMNRIRAGHSMVANPFRRDQIRRVSLLPQDVDVLVFWSKNPAPMLPHLETLRRGGYRFVFQFTLNDYPACFEPHVPPLEDRIRTFLDLADRVGSGLVVWRYDPIIVSRATDFAYHARRFERLARRLAGRTRRVVVSLVDRYRKAERNMATIQDESHRVDWTASERPGMDELLKELSALAVGFDMEIRSCAEPEDRTRCGVRPGGCIDAGLLARLHDITVAQGRDRGQREACLCAVSRDIGTPNTCAHGCRYCYATQSPELATRRLAGHDPGTNAIEGDLTDAAGVSEPPARPATAGPLACRRSASPRQAGAPGTGAASRCRPAAA
ncbi:MAG: DUF1848 domain-containing protein [Candidatus Riflebacteria bacterium]|nr:DUF1848 domain-containing protein [Candidatus Riflebacteria bacterium]